MTSRDKRNPGRRSPAPDSNESGKQPRNHSRRFGVNEIFSTLFMGVIGAVALFVAGVLASQHHWRSALWTTIVAVICLIVGFGFKVDEYLSKRTQEQATKGSQNSQPTVSEADAAGAKIAHERARAKLAIVKARLLEPIAAGVAPTVEITVLNTGPTTADNINLAARGMTGPDLPKWDFSEFTKISETFGTPTPKRDSLHTTSIEPGLAKTRPIPFSQLRPILSADFVAALGKPTKHKNLPTVTPRVFFVGFLTYETLGKTYRLKFCFTPRAYPGTQLVECQQWNGTEEVSAPDTPEKASERDERKVTARVVPLDVSYSTGKTLTANSSLSIIYVNIGPTEAAGLDIDVFASLAPEPIDPNDFTPICRGISMRPFDLFSGKGGIQTQWSQPLKDIFTHPKEAPDITPEILAGSVEFWLISRITFKDAWGITHKYDEALSYNSKTGKFDRSREKIQTAKPGT